MQLHVDLLRLSRQVVEDPEGRVAEMGCREDSVPEVNAHRRSALNDTDERVPRIEHRLEVTEDSNRRSEPG